MAFITYFKATCLVLLILPSLFQLVKAVDAIEQQSMKDLAMAIPKLATHLGWSTTDGSTACSGSWVGVGCINYHVTV